MFDITPKEQTIKQIRKGLVQPLPNQYPLLNFESDIFKKALVLPDEDFVSEWVKNGFYFNSCGNSYDFLSQIMQLKTEKNLGNIALGEKKLIELFNDNGIEHIPAEKIENTLIVSCLKMESSSMTICFSSEVQPIKAIAAAKNLIIYAKNNVVGTPSTKSFISDLNVKNDFRIQLTVDYFKRMKSVYLFMEL
ncbi:MAG: hypothetical protein PSX81_13380 [bacterium]|nr:hypothetical protein [bacterium]